MPQTSPYLTNNQSHTLQGLVCSLKQSNRWAIRLRDCLLNIKAMPVPAHAQYMLSSLIASSP